MSIAVLTDVFLVNMILECLCRRPDVTTAIADKAMFVFGTVVGQLIPAVAIKVTLPRTVVAEPVLRRVEQMIGHNDYST